MATNKPVLKFEPTPVVTVNIKHGPGTPVMQIAWRRFWRKVLVLPKQDAGDNDDSPSK